MCWFSYQTESFHVSCYFPSRKAFASSSLLQNELGARMLLFELLESSLVLEYSSTKVFVESPQICGIWGILIYFAASSDLFSLEEFGYSLYGCLNNILNKYERVSTIISIIRYFWYVHYLAVVPGTVKLTINSLTS